MTTKLYVPLAALPDAIAESAKTVLDAHCYRVVDANGKPLTRGEAMALLDELGRNAAQAIVGLDDSEDK